MPRASREGDPLRSTPVFDRTMRPPSLLLTLLKAALLPGSLLAAIEVCGFPGLKWEYTYRGAHDRRIELSCLYLTTEGPQRLVPPPGADRCPIVRLFPTTILHDLF